MKIIKQSCALLLSLVLTLSVVLQPYVGMAWAQEKNEWDETLSISAPGVPEEPEAPEAPVEAEVLEKEEAPAEPETPVEQEVSVESVTLEKAYAPAEPEAPEEPAAIWETLADEEFAQWLTADENAEAVRTLLMSEDLETYLAFFARIEAILDGDDAELAERVNVYLSSLVGPTAEDMMPVADVPDEYIYFDLNAGSVKITNGNYEGWVFVNGTATKIVGTHTDGNEYYIYQSTTANKSQSGYASDADFSARQNCSIPEYVPMTADGTPGGTPWGEYITNNNSDTPQQIKDKWVTAAGAVGRTSVTANNIVIAENDKAEINVVLDNLWINHSKELNDNSTVASKDTDIETANSFITLKLKGDNRCSFIYALTDPKNKSYVQSNGSAGLTDQKTLESLPFAQANGCLRITSAEGDGETSGTLTLASQKVYSELIKGSGNLSLIGSNDRWVYAGNAGTAGWLILELNGGTLYAGTPKLNNQTIPSTNAGNYIYHCIGSRYRSCITINGGRVTAISNGTAAAIGGGGGFNSEAGVGVVTINGGKTYAYSNSVYSATHSSVIPGNAIGSGSCGRNNAKSGFVTITGGYTYAKSVGGVAIGGGTTLGGANYTTVSGGKATVDISGGVIEAYSIPGTIAAKYVGGNIAIGGGSSAVAAGGDAEITITGGTVTATSDPGTSKTKSVAMGGGVGKTQGGTATINISGSPTITSGSVGGGSADNGKTGYAAVNISESPDIRAQFVMAGGGSKACTFTMSGGTIHNVDTVNTTDYLHEDGGALWMDDSIGKATITGGTIEDCTANLGGAVYMTGGTFTLKGGTIQGCTAAKSGGAVYLDNGTVTVSGGFVHNNTATENGGGIDIHGGEAFIQGGTLSENTATKNGGGVYVGDGTVTISSGSVGEETKANTAENGGGIYIEKGTVTISGGTIAGNTATINGGGLDVHNGTINMTGGTINSNTAQDGAGVYLFNGDFTMNGDGAKISGNHADNNGGGIHLTVTPQLKKGNILSNTAQNDGGGIYIEKQNVVLIPDGDVHISGNGAKRGGGIFVGGTTVSTAGFSVDNSQSGQVLITGNSATDSGGGICLEYGDFTVDNNAVLLYGNSGVNGGAVAVLEGQFTLSGSGEVGKDGEARNVAENGGGVYVNGGNVNVSGSIVNNGAAKGGGVYLSGGEFILDGGTILKNEAQNGGGVYLDRISPSLLSGSVKENKAIVTPVWTIPGNASVSPAGDGGGIYINQKVVELSPTGAVEVSENAAENNGGGLYIYGTNGSDAGFSVASTASGTVGLRGNTAAASGGAVCIKSGYFTLDSEKITVTENGAKNGGGVAVLGGRATISGGTIGASGAANTATNGGGLYVSGGEVLLSGGAVAYNEATNGGGAYISGGELSISGGEISNNTATANGGGAYVSGSIMMTGGSVGGSGKTNSAYDGGGVYVNDGMVTMYGGNIDRNNASHMGGGIFISAQTSSALVDLLSGSVSYNKSADDGGGVAIVSHTNQKIDVVVGVNADHHLGDNRSYAPFLYPAVSDCGNAHVGHTNHLDGKTHSTCPVVIGNSSGSKGGGFYLDGSQTSLTFYCVVERDNTAANSHCDSMYMEGGVVQIVGDQEYTGSGNAKGNIVIESSILVEGGSVDIYGEMTNPQFTENVTVNIQDTERDHYIDHRLYNVENIHYKVHYNENFKGDGTIPTGLYIAKQYPDAEHESLTGSVRYTMSIMSSIFTRPGYKIIGWCTNPNPGSLDIEHPNPGDYWYKVNNTYHLDQLTDVQGMGINTVAGKLDPYLLRIYAIWERCGYVLQYDPNVPEGNPYSGSMEAQQVTVGLLDGSQTLRENAFKRKGYLFLGWTLSPDGTGTLYTDAQTITVDFTEEDGAIIPLYAKWELCEHTGHLSYSADGDTITETCTACNDHTATAVITAVDASYDEHEHPASVTYSAQWLGGNLDVSYEMAASDWDSKDEIDNDWNAAQAPVPVHAGSYTAKITVSDATASVQYFIKPVQWPIPAVPNIVFKIVDSKSLIEVSTPTGEGIQYKITRLENDMETAVDGYQDWQESNIFSGNGIQNGFYYYFYAKKCADRDHLESVPSQSEAYLATGGNIVYINNDTGIKVKFESGTGDFVYTVTPADGYHFRNYHDNADTAAANAQPIEGADEAYNHGGITVEKQQVTDGYQYTVKFEDSKVAYYQVTLDFQGAAKDATVDAKATDGEVFSDFNGQPVNISRDSAFTASFTVNDVIPDEYSKWAVAFDQSLPAGTTMILKENGNYWYYVLDSATNAVDLKNFTAMGGTEKFSYNTAGTEVLPVFTYQFIVDFSQVSAVAYPTGEFLQMALNLTHNSSFLAPDIPADGLYPVKIQLKDSAQFDMTNSADGKTATLTCDYTASLGAASIWRDRKTALVLKPVGSIPSDLTLTAVVDGITTVYPQNNDGLFLVPLSVLDNHSVQLTPKSATFGTTPQELTFQADWYVSSSGAAPSPLSGLKAATVENLTFSCTADIKPSLRIDGSYRLRQAGEELPVTVRYAGIPEEGSMVANLQRKGDDGGYVDTGDRRTVVPNVSGTTGISFNMGSMAPGSYRILVTVSLHGGKLLDVPYYFLITKS